MDTSDGSSRIVPGSRLREWPELSWSTSSRCLFFRPYGDREMAYRPGAPRAVRLPFRPRRRAIAFVAD